MQGKRFELGQRFRGSGRDAFANKKGTQRNRVPENHWVDDLYSVPFNVYTTPLNDPLYPAHQI